LGASGGQLRYKATKPDVLGFTFLFDGTGVLLAAASGRGAAGAALPVRDQIERFKRVTLNFKGNIHQPRFLQIVWGSLLFKGRLLNLKITYTLFSPAGLPLRARATAGFKGSIDRGTRALMERTSSPDLTHVRIVKEGDTLPALSHEIYGDPGHYLELARVNKLTNFRRLAPGTRLMFPPIAR
jgi:nucleoid-associated protein YgaU